MSKAGLLAAAAAAMAAAAPAMAAESESKILTYPTHHDSVGIFQATKRSGNGYARKPSNVAKHKRASLKAKAKKLEKIRRKNRRK